MRLAGRYALLADDDDDWRHLAAASLRRAGLQVCEATNGRDLVAQYCELCAGGDGPAVVVSDIQMPVASGIEAAQALREEAPGLPIVLLTGLKDTSTRRLAHAAGATLVLTKPVAPEELRRAVASLIDSIEP